MVAKIGEKTQGLGFKMIPMIFCMLAGQLDSAIVTLKQNEFEDGKQVASVTTRSGSEIKVRLEHNATGYLWRLKSDADGVKVKGDPTIEREANIPGSPEFKVYTILAQESGIVRFELYKPNGPENPRVAEVKVEVKKPMKDQCADLVKSQETGVLSTNFEDSYPFGSLVPYALDEKGNPIIYVSDLAIHTDNLKKYSKCTLTVSKINGQDVFNSSRATILAEANKVDAKEVSEIYFKKFPDAKKFAKMHDFSFYRLEVQKTYFVGGFGNIGWVEK